MSAKATGAAPNGNASGNTKNRSHHDGREGRAFTVEQKAAVIRVKKCSPTAFYDILGLESEKTTIDDVGIKKAYRKLSLLTHPDKNGYDGADEAFKLVSRAFQILSDPDKKKRYDQFGGDPDNRFSSSSASSPFSGFARSPGAARAGSGMFEEEISPEELFRQFFGGGGMAGGPFGGGLFNNGPGFVFNLGGGPGIRVHQFGGTRPRRRPPGATGARPDDEMPNASSIFHNLLPLLILFVVPILTSLLGSGGSFFSGSSGTQARMPYFSVGTPSPPYTERHETERLKVPYFVNPADVEDFGPKKWQSLSQAVDYRHLGDLNRECDLEINRRENLFREAQGWFFIDNDKVEEARAFELKSCNKLYSLTGRKQQRS